ncbi:MAG: VTT domain-containing protein [Patescibacteria group bacterium]|jgi:uncharacterized membrane protein YdjX (TVP38/TMEM64 family)|nr:VTT domain-containing protein [Patescibacteria group bacterium]
MKILNEFGQKNREEKIKIVSSTLIIAILFLISSYIFNSYQTDIQKVIGLKSLTGMLLYILIFILSIVLIPISSMPLIPMGTKLWGIGMTTVLSTIGWTIGALIAFNIARRFGRPHIAKIIPLKKIEKIEKLIPNQNIFWTIFFLRMVTPFDGLSYVLGLITRVETKTFFWATLLGLIPFCLTIAFLGSLPTTYLIIGLVLAGVFFMIGIYRMEQKKIKLAQKSQKIINPNERPAPKYQKNY